AQRVVGAAVEAATWPPVLQRAARVAGSFLPYDPASHHTIAAHFERHAAAQPEVPFLLYRDERYTYGAANAIVNRHVRAYRELGLKQGDVVALLPENRPEFYWHFLALAKLGIVSSLINANIVGAPLAHAIRICAPARIVVGSECLAAFDAVRPNLG